MIRRRGLHWRWFYVGKKATLWMWSKILALAEVCVFESGRCYDATTEFMLVGVDSRFWNGFRLVAGRVWMFLVDRMIRLD